MNWPRFAAILLALAVVLGIIVYTLVPHYHAYAMPWCLGAVAACASFTLLGFMLSNRALGARPGQFINAVLGSTLLKLMASMAFIGLVGLVADGDVLTPFIVVYMGCYLAFTGFEVWALLANLRRLSKKAP